MSAVHTTHQLILYERSLATADTKSGGVGIKGSSRANFEPVSDSYLSMTFEPKGFVSQLNTKAHPAMAKDLLLLHNKGLQSVSRRSFSFENLLVFKKRV
jgi:hypothetical protein